MATNKAKTPQKKVDQKIRTARNQIKRYKKALEKMNGADRDIILKKIEYYESCL